MLFHWLYNFPKPGMTFNIKLTYLEVLITGYLSIFLDSNR